MHSPHNINNTQNACIFITSILSITVLWLFILILTRARYTPQHHPFQPIKLLQETLQDSIGEMVKGLRMDTLRNSITQYSEVMKEQYMNKVPPQPSRFIGPLILLPDWSDSAQDVKHRASHRVLARHGQPDLIYWSGAATGVLSCIHSYFFFHPHFVTWQANGFAVMADKINFYRY